MHGSSKLPQRLAPAAIRLAAAWVLLGGLAKLFVGSPNDLPALVRDLFHDHELAFKIVIAGELAVAAAALIAPRLGWPLVAALMLAFLVVLGGQIAAGKTSCGCFGGRIQVRPEVMFGIDLSALAAVLCARPWSQGPSAGGRLLLLAPVMLLALAAPWLLPASGSRYVTLDPRDWVGKPYGETAIAQYLPASRLDPFDKSSVLVLYRVSCEHCARHLASLAENLETAFVLVKVPEPPDRKSVLGKKPGLLEVALPEGPDWGVHVPTEVVLDAAGRVAKVNMIVE